MIRCGLPLVVWPAPPPARRFCDITDAPATNFGNPSCLTRKSLVRSLLQGPTHGSRLHLISIVDAHRAISLNVVLFHVITLQASEYIVTTWLRSPGFSNLQVAVYLSAIAERSLEAKLLLSRSCARGRAGPSLGRTHASTMAPFSMLRRSPRSRKGSEQQKDEDDVKIEGDTLAQEVDQRESNRTMAGSKDTVDGEIKGRRGFNRDLLHSIRSRLTGKPSSSTPQRGTATEVRTTIQPLHLPSCTTILDVGCSHQIRCNCIM
jgi:hypothetical protein